MKNPTFYVIAGVALASLAFVLAWRLITELRNIHERSAVKAIAAALAADVRSGANLSVIFRQSQSPYRMAGDSYAQWMEDKHRDGKLDAANDFTVDAWGNRYEIRAESSKDGSIKLSVSSSGKDGQFGTVDDIVAESVMR